MKQNKAKPRQNGEAACPFSSLEMLFCEIWVRDKNHWLATIHTPNIAMGYQFA
jgi:hypothetical protein